MGKFKAQLLIDAEYEELFPYEQEYESWIAAVERDYQEECEARAGIIVPDKGKFKYGIQTPKEVPQRKTGTG